MMPTSDDAPPRKDGWYQHRGTWEEVTVGTVLEGPKVSERWEVIATAHGGPVKYGYTLWIRIREQTSGEEHTIEPRPKTNPVTILTQNPRDRTTAPPTEPTDTEAIQLLIAELGAEILAHRDERTGEIVCPDYIYRSHIPGHGQRQKSRGLVDHLRFAHKLSVDDDMDHDAAHALHSQAHDPRWPNIGKEGFGHRHVPEDLSQF